MATTHYLISKQVVGAALASSVTFSNIPQTYTDLKIFASTRTTGSGSDLTLQFNAISSGYSWRQVYGTGSSAASDTLSSQTTINRAGRVNPSSTTANVFSVNEITIPNYTGSTKKIIGVEGAYEDNATANRVTSIAGLSSNTAAITSITLAIDGGGNFSQYSSFSLYGVSSSGDATKVPYASGGDVIATDGTYWIHTFYNSGTFTPLKSLSNVDYLVVAGGGGGGKRNDTNNGAGGAGGLRSTVSATGGGGSVESKLSLTAQAYTVTVGAGGAGATVSFNNGSSGGQSVFSTITSTGGGGGGVAGYNSAYSGGSGGGGGSNGELGAAGTSGQGYAGANGLSGDGGSGGGGGAGGAGAQGTGTYSSGTGGAGGVGVSNSISGTATYYAGGGGGAGTTAGTGGNGGGGAGSSSSVTAGNGTTNLGGGGGGGRHTYNGGSGGSGIVIVRYPV